MLIYRLITRGTIEERMMEMTKKKMLLEHLVVGSIKTQNFKQVIIIFFCWKIEVFVLQIDDNSLLSHFQTVDWLFTMLMLDEWSWLQAKNLPQYHGGRHCNLLWKLDSSNYNIISVLKVIPKELLNAIKLIIMYIKKNK